jgi:hypothetical protein
MNKKRTNNAKEFRTQNHENKKMNTHENFNKEKDKKLPLWVEILFVQIGLPDNLLIGILKAKKQSKELFKKDKKSLLITLFIFAVLAYFYPVIKHAKNKLYCEKVAKNYIINHKNLTRIKKRELKMLSTNFCYGGEEIYEIKNSNN